MNADEKKAQKVINTIRSLREKPGVDIYVDLTALHNELIKVDIEQYGKEILLTKINMKKLSEKTRDDLTYAAVDSLFE